MAEKPTHESLKQQIELLEQTLTRQKRFEEINRMLFQISNSVNMSSDLNELFRTIHIALSPVIDTTNFFIALYDVISDSISFPYCVDSVDSHYPPVVEISKTESLTAEVIRKGLPLMVTKAEILGQRARSGLKIPDCTPSEIWLGVPLKTRDKIIGVMAVQSYIDPKRYDQTDMKVMATVADQVALVIERKQAEEALRLAHDKLEQRVAERTEKLRRANADLQAQITERKKIETEKKKIEEQNWQLQKAESLGRMASSIAHTFNNQFHAVMGNLEMAMNELHLGKNPIERLAACMTAVRKASEVSGLMLTYLGQAIGEREQMDLSEACRQTLPLIQAAAPKNMLIKADFPASGPTIRAISGQMLHVLTNLITNAWESADESRRGICLTVKTVLRENIPASKRFPIDWQPRDPAYGCIEVADAGCGIAENDIENIFDPFFSTKFTGRGLGLPVVLGIVRAHNGAITVESIPGKGSIFRAFFPISAEVAPLQQDKAVQAPEIAGAGTVLLVEDNEMVREMAAEMLSQLGFSMVEAVDGVEAVDAFRKRRDEIRFVLSDVTMPRMDGWETLCALRELVPGIPVILSSGYDEAHVMAGAHCEHPDSFLGKPYQIKQLRDTINRVLTGD